MVTVYTTSGRHQFGQENSSTATFAAISKFRFLYGHYLREIVNDLSIDLVMSTRPSRLQCSIS